MRTMLHGLSDGPRRICGGGAFKLCDHIGKHQSSIVHREDMLHRAIEDILVGGDL
jgi:hypothetical protein